MIKKAEEFIRLRDSDDIKEFTRTIYEKPSDWLCIDIIANHQDYVRGIAWNKKVSHNILAILVNYPNKHVQFDLSMRVDLSKELYVKLSKSMFSLVRSTISCNAAVPFEVLQGMYPDRCADINERLELRLGLVKPDIDGWMGGTIDDDEKFHPFEKGTKEYNNRRKQLRRFFKKYCLPYKEE